VLLYALGVAWVWRRERQPPVVGEGAEAGTGQGEEASSKALLFVLLGVLAMVAGGYLAVRGAEVLADVLDLRESVVGLTVLALATSAEMLALVRAARRRGLPEIVVAGAVGAVAYNATVSLGLAALVSPLGLGRHSAVLKVAALTAVLPLLLLTGRRSGTLPRTLAALLVLAYVAIAGRLLTA
jgi:cation:H+ antiporter